MGFRVCRNGAGRFQNVGRSARSMSFCGIYGYFPRDLFQIWGKNCFTKSPYGRGRRLRHRILYVCLCTLGRGRLAGCAVVGFSAGVMWPGVFSFASGKLPKGGTAMFALLALAGDVGCSAGPSAVGAVGDAFGGSLRAGIAFGLLFPALMFIVLLLYGISRRKENRRALAAYMHPDGSAVQSDGSLSADSGELRETDAHALSEDPNERSVASHAGKGGERPRA